MEAEVSDLTERLESRKAVERAKGLLQSGLGLSEPEAFRWIQKTAMDLRKSMREVAKESSSTAQQQRKIEYSHLCALNRVTNVLQIAKLTSLHSFGRRFDNAREVCAPRASPNEQQEEMCASISSFCGNPARRVAGDVGMWHPG